jgi:hypothetical protein
MGWGGWGVGGGEARGAESGGENKRGRGWGRIRGVDGWGWGGGHLSGPSRAIKLLYAPAPPRPQYGLGE